MKRDINPTPFGKRRSFCIKEPLDLHIAQSGAFSCNPKE